MAGEGPQGREEGGGQGLQQVPHLQLKEGRAPSGMEAERQERGIGPGLPSESVASGVCGQEILRPSVLCMTAWLVSFFGGSVTFRSG